MGRYGRITGGVTDMCDGGGTYYGVANINKFYGDSGANINKFYGDKWGKMTTFGLRTECMLSYG